MMPFYANMQTTEYVIFSFLYDITEESEDIRRELSTTTTSHPYSHVLRCKVFNTTNVLRYTTDICWFGLRQEHWRKFCKEKGKMSRLDMSTFDRLYVNEYLYPIVTRLTTNAKTSVRNITTSKLKQFQVGYLNITLTLFNIKRNLGETHPLVSWYTYVSYLVSEVYLAHQTKNQEVTTLYALKSVLKYATLKEPITVGNSDNRNMNPSSIVWLYDILKYNEFDPYTITLPRRLVSYCQDILKGGVRFFDAFGKIADSTCASGDDFNAERNIATKHSNSDQSVVRVDDVSLSKWSYTKNMVESQFYNILGHHFSNEKDADKVFHEDQSALDVLLKNFSSKLKEIGERSRCKETSRLSSSLTFKNRFNVSQRDRRKKDILGLSEDGKPKFKTSHIGLGKTLSKRNVLKALCSANPAQFGLIGNMNWFSNTQFLSCFSERKTFVSMPPLPSSSSSTTEMAKEIESPIVKKFVSEVIPDVNVHAPTLRRFETKAFYSYTKLHDVTKFVAPFTNDEALMNAVENHLENGPNTKTFKLYCQEVLRIMADNNYNFHEVITPNQPLFAFSLDLDSNDKALSERFHLAKESDMWSVQIEFFQFIKDIICLHFKQWYNISDMKETSVFAFYMSLPDSNKKRDVLSKGIRGRIVWRSTKYCLDGPESAFNLSKNLDRYIKDVLVLDSTTFIDANVYQVANGRYGLLRLPMCFKEDLSNVKRPLVPMIYEPCNTFIPSFGLVHHMHSTFKRDEALVLAIPSEKKRYSFRELNEKSMVLKKHSKEYDIGITQSLDDEIYRAIVIEKLPVIKDILKQKVLANAHMIDEVITPHSVTYKRRGTYSLTNNVYACFGKAHVDEKGNPCSYMVILTNTTNAESPKIFNDKSSKTSTTPSMSCSIYGYCFACGSKLLSVFEI